MRVYSFTGVSLLSGKVAPAAIVCAAGARVPPFALKDTVCVAAGSSGPVEF